MKVVVTYDKFNSILESASIAVDTDSSFEFSIIKVDEENSKLEIKATDTLTQEDIILQMDESEVREFNLLLSQFIRQL